MMVCSCRMAKQVFERCNVDIECLLLTCNSPAVNHCKTTVALEVDTVYICVRMYRPSSIDTLIALLRNALQQRWIRLLVPRLGDDEDIRAFIDNRTTQNCRFIGSWSCIHTANFQFTISWSCAERSPSPRACTPLPLTLWMKPLTAWSPQPVAKNSLSHTPGWNDVIAIQCPQLLRRVRKHGDSQSPPPKTATWNSSLTKSDDYVTNVSENSTRNIRHESASPTINSEQLQTRR